MSPMFVTPVMYASRCRSMSVGWGPKPIKPVLQRAGSAVFPQSASPIMGKREATRTTSPAARRGRRSSGAARPRQASTPVVYPRLAFY